MSIATNILLVVEILISLFLLLLVLMQRPKSEGIGASIGGSMMNELFSAQTTNVLQTATRWLGGAFFLLAMIISMLISHGSRSDVRSAAQRQLAAAPVPKDVKSIDLNLKGAPTQEELLKMLQNGKANAISGSNADSGTDAPKTTGTSTSGTTASGSAAAPSASATPAASGTGGTGDSSSSGLDLGSPSLQLGTGQQPAASSPGGGVQLQTGTASKGGLDLQGH